MATPPSAPVNPEFVERYQLELQKDPRSRVFAPLAEAYRKMGLIEEARRICERGVGFHKNFAGGHVAYAKVLLDLKLPDAAVPHLETACKLSPDNLMAHSLLGETLLQVRRPKDALKAFKMVLFLNPNDQRAQAAVRKWEFLTADEYDDEVFEMKPVFEATKAKAEVSFDDELEQLLEDTNPTLAKTSPAATRIDLAQRHARALERAVSLADAFTIRNDLEAAIKVLEDAVRLLGPNPEVVKRREILLKRLQVLEDEGEGDAGPEPDGMDLAAGGAGTNAGLDEIEFEAGPEASRRREILENLLRRINERRN